MMNDYHCDYMTPAQDDYSYSGRDGHGPLSPPSPPRPKKQRILHVTPVPLESYLMLPDLDEISLQSHSMYNRSVDDFEFRLKPRTVSPPLPSSIMMMVVDQRPGMVEETEATPMKRPRQFHCPRRASLALRTSSNRSTSNSSNNSAPTRLVNPSRADSAEW